MNIKNVSLEKSICFAIDTINKVAPIKAIDSISCFYSWVDSIHKMKTYGESFVQSDYYHGSENDFVNIFKEIASLATTDHCYNGKYVLERLKFLANEGLFLTELQAANTKTFKLKPKEINELITSLSKTPKKKSTKKKPVKKIKRDKNGKFTRTK